MSTASSALDSQQCCFSCPGLPWCFCLQFFQISSPAQVRSPVWTSFSLLVPSQVFGLKWWPSNCNSKVGTFLWFWATSRASWKGWLYCLCLFGFAHDKNPNVNGLGKNADELAQRMWVNDLNSQTMGRTERCSNMIKAFALPSVLASFCTLTFSY